MCQEGASVSWHHAAICWSNVTQNPISQSTVVNRMEERLRLSAPVYLPRQDPHPPSLTNLLGIEFKPFSPQSHLLPFIPSSASASFFLSFFFFLSGRFQTCSYSPANPLSQCSTFTALTPFLRPSAVCLSQSSTLHLSSTKAKLKKHYLCLCVCLAHICAVCDVLYNHREQNCQSKLKCFVLLFNVLSSVPCALHPTPPSSVVCSESRVNLTHLSPFCPSELSVLNLERTVYLPRLPVPSKIPFFFLSYPLHTILP